MSIKGGIKNFSANPHDVNDEGIFISRLNEEGAVARDRRLFVGQRILEVNGTSLLGSTHQEAVRALRSVGDKMVIMVCDGFDPTSASEVSTPSSPVGFLASSSQGSVASIDRIEDSKFTRGKRDEDEDEDTANTTAEMLQEHAQIRGPETPEKQPINDEPPPLPKSSPPIIRADHPHITSAKVKPPVPPKRVGLVRQGDSMDETGADPRLQAKLPSGKLLTHKNVNNEGSNVSFVDKRRFFEKEIKDQNTTKTQSKTFSYLADHEVAKMKLEEEKKTSSMSQDEIRSFVAEPVTDHDYKQVMQNPLPEGGIVRTAKAERRLSDRVSPGNYSDGEKLSPAEERELQAEKRAAWRQARMKSLEADAVRAQAVIAHAKELSKDSSPVAPTLSTVDIAFADDDDDDDANSSYRQNGQHSASQVEVTKQQIYEVNIQQSPVSHYNSASGAHR